MQRIALITIRRHNHLPGISRNIHVEFYLRVAPTRHIQIWDPNASQADMLVAGAAEQRTRIITEARACERDEPATRVWYAADRYDFRLHPEEEIGIACRTARSNCDQTDQGELLWRK